MIYRRTKNIRAVQLLLWHTKLESMVRYLGIEVDDALEIAEQTDVSGGVNAGWWATADGCYLVLNGRSGSEPRPAAMAD